MVSYATNWVKMTTHADPPPGAAAGWTIPQGWDSYTTSEHAVWDTVFARQSKMLPGRATDAFLRGLDVLRLSRPGIPDFTELSQRLQALTGWGAVAVAGLGRGDLLF